MIYLKYITQAEVTTMTPEEEIVYVAGIFDGEGSNAACIGSRKSFSLHFSATIHQKDTRLLEWIRKRFEGRIHTDKRGQSRLVWSSSNAYLFLVVVRPYLIVKALDADEMLEIWENRSDHTFLKGLSAARKARLADKKEKTLILKRLRMYLPV